MRNILITGGAGFIGSNFIHYLRQVESGARIVNLDALTYAGNLDNLIDMPSNEHYMFVQGDICDQSLVSSIFEEYAIDTVVHFAAESHVDRSILGPMPFIQSNIVGTATLLECAKNTGWLISACPLMQSDFIIFPPMKYSDRSDQVNLLLLKNPLMHPTPPMPPAKLPATTWCKHTFIPIIFLSPFPTVQII